MSRLLSPLFSSEQPRRRCEDSERATRSSEHTSRSKMTPITRSLSLDSTTDNDIDSVSIVSFPEEEAMANSGAAALLDHTSEAQAPRKSVRFANVELREYEMCLGDNPAVARGAPVSLDWKYNRERSYKSLDDFEGSEHSKGKLGYGLGVATKRPSLERLHLLKDLGYSREEIKEATDTAQLIQRQRFRTRRRSERAERFQEAFNVLTCLCQPWEKFCDPFEKLGESISTVSTRSSTGSNSTTGSFDWANSRESASNSGGKQRSITSKTLERRRGRRRRDAKEDLQHKVKHRLQRQWHLWGQHQQKFHDPFDSERLDTARHSAIVLLGDPGDS